MELSKGLVRYKTIDLSIWIILLGVFETIIAVSSNKWFKSQPYTVSLVPFLTLVVYMRWGLWGLGYSFLGGLFLSLASDASFLQFSVYSCGNLFSFLSYLLIKRVGKERVKDSAFFTVIVSLSVAISMQMGRALMSIVVGGSLEKAIDFFTTDSLSGFFTVVLALVARKRDGLFEDQLCYLRRLEKEREEERIKDEN